MTNEDVSRFFTTESEDIAKGIAEKYGANIIYIPKQRFNDLIGVMFFTANPGFKPDENIKTPEAYFENIIKPTTGYKFSIGADLKNFDKIFENNDVVIYELKKI